MQNGKTIKTRKNVDFNVDIFIIHKNDIEVFTDKDLSAKMEASVLPALL